MKKKHVLLSRIWDLKLVILLVVLVVVLMLLYVDFSKVNPFKEKKYFTIRDQCGVLPGAINLLHTINNEEECDVQCFGRCMAEDLKKVKSVFLEREARCHDCTCVCR